MSLQIAQFTFNAFQENTYVLYDESNECIIIDPGCNSDSEQKELANFISSSQLKPVRLLNTHCHIDHVLGNKFVADRYGLQLEAHLGEKPVLESCEMISQMYGIQYNPSPPISIGLAEEDEIRFGNITLKILFTPGHSPASISFYEPDSQSLIGGDVLFYGSIGRTDLPGGDFDTLISSIKENFLVLPEATKVYSGHGPVTTIGFEKKNNPFLK